MNKLALYAVPLFLMVLGESTMIMAEVYSSIHSWKDWRVILVQIFAAMVLIYGYDVSYKRLNSVWMVSVLSVLTIVVAEPIIVWFMTKEEPSKSTAIAFALACISLVVLTFGEK